MKLSWRKLGMAALTLTLMAGPALAQDEVVISRGSDLWVTAEGTYSELNLPAGFFGERCPPFKGQVALVGVPVETTPEGELGGADTVVERLKDAEFSGGEKAVVPIVVRALHFRAAEPLKTECGEWDADVELAGEQKTTEMTIVRESEEGGFFIASISVDVVWTFTNKDGKQAALHTSNILTSDEPTPYSSKPCAKAASVRDSFILNASSRAVRRIKVAAPSSNFHPGFDKDCKPVKPCRGKNLDPARHCYEPYTPGDVVAQ